MEPLAKPEPSTHEEITACEMGRKEEVGVEYMATGTLLNLNLKQDSTGLKKSATKENVKKAAAKLRLILPKTKQLDPPSTTMSRKPLADLPNASTSCGKSNAKNEMTFPKNGEAMPTAKSTAEATKEKKKTTRSKPKQNMTKKQGRISSKKTQKPSPNERQVVSIQFVRNRKKIRDQAQQTELSPPDLSCAANTSGGTSQVTLGNNSYPTTPGLSCGGHSSSSNPCTEVSPRAISMSGAPFASARAFATAARQDSGKSSAPYSPLPLPVSIAYRTPSRNAQYRRFLSRLERYRASRPYVPSPLSRDMSSNSPGLEMPLAGLQSASASLDDTTTLVASSSPCLLDFSVSSSPCPNNRSAPILPLGSSGLPICAAASGTSQPSHKLEKLHNHAVPGCPDDYCQEHPTKIKKYGMGIGLLPSPIIRESSAYTGIAITAPTTFLATDLFDPVPLGPVEAGVLDDLSDHRWGWTMYDSR